MTSPSASRAIERRGGVQRRVAVSLLYRLEAQGASPAGGGTGRSAPAALVQLTARRAEEADEQREAWSVFMWAVQRAGPSNMRDLLRTCGVTSPADVLENRSTRVSRRASLRARSALHGIGAARRTDEDAWKEVWRRFLHGRALADDLAAAGAGSRTAKHPPQQPARDIGGRALAGRSRPWSAGAPKGPGFTVTAIVTLAVSLEGTPRFCRSQRDAVPAVAVAEPVACFSWPISTTRVEAQGHAQRDP